MVLIIALPFIYIVSALTDYATDAEQWITNAKANGIPALPEWIAGLPVVGKNHRLATASGQPSNCNCNL
jgi:hypothetical protein